MNVRKFIAATARDALHKVKEMLGPDAIILSNRAIPGGVEIMAVAAGEMDAIVTSPRAAAAPASVPPMQEDYTVRLSSEAVPSNRVANPIPPLTSRPAPQFEPANIAVPRAAEVVPAEVMAEIRALRRIVEQHLAGAAWGETARREPVKTEILRQMLDAGFSPRLAHELLAELPLDLDQKGALGWVKATTERCLQTLDAQSDIVDRGGVYALVGPTGVGKTTTTAKLAARCVLRHGASKVALITTDGYRIGAYEQLRIYGRILGVSVHLVKDAGELRQTLLDLQHKHMILIDTMGMSQRDKMVAEQVAMFDGSPVKRLLLLAATGRGDTLDDVVRAYAGPDVVGCILSKVDEAAGLASSLDVIMRHQLRLHYVSNGQRVPEDLHLPNRAYLLHRAFKDVPEVSPHRLSGNEPGLMMASAGLVAAGGRRG
ncbi:MAG: flagellar biosynthesis protein FlhF [Propionivibrio sp.]